MSTALTSIDAAGLRRLVPAGLDALQLVFVNGQYTAALSSAPKIPGLRFDDSEGIQVQLEKGTSLVEPVHLVFVAAGTSPANPRVTLHAGANSKASVIETYISPANDAYATNAITEAVLEDNARLDHYKVERESLSADHISTLNVRQARASVLTSHVLLLGGSQVRNNINVLLEGEGAECTLNGLYLTTGEQKVDTHTLIDHVKPHCQSREYYKGILDNHSQGIFFGHIIVRPDAQKSDAMQTNKNLLLSNDAKINTKPELKIFANDVKCKHGATVGQINADALFYLRSRGIDRDEARRLLIHAFAGEMIEKIGVAPLREGLSELLFAKFK